MGNTEDISKPGTWYLFDYGMVISTAPEPADWAALKLETGQHLQDPASPYWTHRESYDAGLLSPAAYWAAVLALPEADEERVRVLEDLDAAQWSHLNPDTAGILRALEGEGAKLAVLSNMPTEMSRRYLRDSAWARHFAKTYFSGPLGMTKPDRRIFELVLKDLHAEPGDVVFIDDNEANISAARALGIRTVHFRPPGDADPTDLRELLGRM
ncbi:HAD family hydrolase [Arthrobacter sp. zg-Y750]|uniref:HAD family hydrolase n=1 Tax=Arthrobacter sp. zg-Y750 TaxID=2894189 RepID=UPI001E5CF204|nr:HAD family phosphatase [Arthrobacter sp. zg-Y750]MCC9177689.1 HAD family phosphatase [Arthrobacter sp. zg-Y750]